MNQTDRAHLRRTLELATMGRLWVTPNPMVGCVIVKGGRVVSEAFHRRFGGPHAEVLALAAAGARARGATMYVTLEPCPHHGKTPPCTDAIVRAGVKRVVACTRDPNPLVAGKGFAALRKSGIEVNSGELRGEAVRLNEKFFSAHIHGKPFVAVKLAQTLDGRIADRKGQSKWITSLGSRKKAHELRSEYEAVLVGARTVLRDDPALNVRLVKGRQPVRILLDGRFRTREDARIFRSVGGRVVLVTSIPALERHSRRAALLERRGVEVVGIGPTEKIRIQSIVDYLVESAMSSVLIEGGAETASDFVEAGVVQKLHLFVAPRLLGSGTPSFLLGRARPLEQVRRLHQVTVEHIASDLYIAGRLP